MTTHNSLHITRYNRAAKLTTSCQSNRKDERLFGRFVFVMKRYFSAIPIAAFFIFFLPNCLFAQDLTGIWRGRFVSESGDEYRLEFQIRQTGNQLVTGVSYSYLDVRFYGKTTMTGNFKKANQVLDIQEIKTIELKMDAGSFACIMKYNLEYAKSGKEEFLEGTFTSSFEKTSMFAKKGGDCGGGTVFLRKVPTSDFYVEPFLRPKEEPKKDTIVNKPKVNVPVVKNTPSKTNTTVKKTTQQNNTVVKKSITNQQTKTTVKKTPDQTKTNPQLVKIDTVRNIITQPVTKKPDEKKVLTVVPPILKERENALAKAITVHTKEVIIKLYDNGEIDGDTISIYVDKRLALSHQGLTAQPILYTLHFDDDNAEHEVVMVAENMGRIPPNTSLMIIETGDKRYQVQITSTEQKNAMVRFKYEKP